MLSSFNGLTETELCVCVSLCVCDKHTSHEETRT